MVKMEEVLMTTNFNIKGDKWVINLYERRFNDPIYAVVTYLNGLEHSTHPAYSYLVAKSNFEAASILGKQMEELYGK